MIQKQAERYREKREIIARRRRAKMVKSKLSDYNCWLSAPPCKICDAYEFCRDACSGMPCEDTRLQFMISKGLI